MTSENHPVPFPVNFLKRVEFQEQLLFTCLGVGPLTISTSVSALQELFTQQCCNVPLLVWAVGTKPVFRSTLGVEMKSNCPTAALNYSDLTLSIWNVSSSSIQCQWNSVLFMCLLMEATCLIDVQVNFLNIPELLFFATSPLNYWAAERQSSKIGDDDDYRPSSPHQKSLLH